MNDEGEISGVLVSSGTKPYAIFAAAADVERFARDLTSSRIKR